MFPDPCGQTLADAVLAGADPLTVIPDEYVMVRGGEQPEPDTGVWLCGAVGATLLGAARAVPHGRIRIASVGSIRMAGGQVKWSPAQSRLGAMNLQHVDFRVTVPGLFSELQANPVPRRLRIDGSRTP
jgi:hypothetical protein